MIILRLFKWNLWLCRAADHPFERGFQAGLNRNYAAVGMTQPVGVPPSSGSPTEAQCTCPLGDKYWLRTWYCPIHGAATQTDLTGKFPNERLV